MISFITHSVCAVSASQNIAVGAKHVRCRATLPRRSLRAAVTSHRTSHSHKVGRGERLVVRASESTPPPRWQRQNDQSAIPDSDELFPTQAELVKKVQLTVEDLRKTGVQQREINLWVLGSYSDTKGVGLLQQVINDTVPEDLPSDSLMKMQKIYALLQDVLMDKIEDSEEDTNRVESILTDNLDMSEDEKRALAGSLSTGSKVAIDNALWSSITLVIIGLSLFNFLRGGFGN